MILFVMNFRMAIELEFGGKRFATKFTSLLSTISYSNQIRTHDGTILKDSLRRLSELKNSLDNPPSLSKLYQRTDT